MSIFTNDDVAAFGANYLSLVQSYLPVPVSSFTAPFLLDLLQAAESDISQKLRVYLEPTKIFPFSPSASDLQPLTTTGMFGNIVSQTAWAEEPGYDYDPDFFSGNGYGFLVLKQHPVISIDFIRFQYPSPFNTFYTIPTAWVRFDKKTGQVNLVPEAASFTAPLTAFQLTALGGGTTIPFMMQVQYTAGLENVKTDPKWANLRQAIYQQAVVNMLNNSVLPASSSISADGLSRSKSVKISDYQDNIERTLFGPKGSNGGLWTFIHGVEGTMMGSPY